MSTQENNLKAIADAIREKEGTQNLIPAKDFAARIRSLETGGLPSNVHTVNLSVNNAGYGSVSGGGPVSAGMILNVAATPAAGCIFVGWQENGQTISNTSRYAFTVSKNCDLIAQFASRLPDRYIEIAYVEFDQHSTINTGVSVVLNKIRIVVNADFSVDTVSNGNKYVFYSSFKAGSSYYNGYLKKYYSSYWQVGYGATASGKITDYLTGEANIELDGFNGVFKINDYGTSLPFSGSVSTMYIGYPSSGYVTCPMQLRSFKMYKDSADNLVADFVPCINPDGVVGLYDIVRKAFYKNNGTGSFIAGPAVR